MEALFGQLYRKAFTARTQRLIDAPCGAARHWPEFRRNSHTTAGSKRS